MSRVREGEKGQTDVGSTAGPQRLPVPDGSTSMRLFLEAREGRSSAVGRLFRRLLPEMTGWARGRLPVWARSRMDTDDLVQEAFGAVFRRLDRFEPRRKRALRAYLKRAIRNRILDEVRRAGKVEVSPALPMDSPGFDTSPLDRAILSENLRRYHSGLDRLTEPDRELIVGRIELGYSYEQLALATGRPSADAARVAVRRALVRLASEMNAD
jgi:RNA polymerase sigma factor (sigma-70 family)